MNPLRVNDHFILDKFSYFKICGYSPHPGQLKVHQSPARFRVLVAGRRWGKSLLAAKEVEPVLMLPGRRVWVVAPTYDLANKVFREVWDSLIVKRQLPTLRKSEGELYIRFLWGATLEGKSAENPDSLVGEGLDLLVIDESARMSPLVWERYLRPTLTDKMGQALFISTPEGYNWFYQLYLRGQDGGEWESFRFPSWENPHLPAKDIEEAKRSLSQETFAQEYGAQFTTFAGRVYKEFDRNIHVVEPFPIPSEWRKVRGIDFGYTNPFVCLFIAIDPDENIYIYDEHYERERLTDDHYQEVIKRPGPFYATYCDPSERQWIEDWRARGLNLTPANNDLRAGIELVREKLKVKGDGRPSLFVFKDCKMTIFEFEHYRYPEKIPDSEQPEKRNDHAMDALRYALMGIREPVAADLGWEPGLGEPFEKGFPEKM